MGPETVTVHALSAPLNPNPDMPTATLPDRGAAITFGVSVTCAVGDPTVKVTDAANGPGAGELSVTVTV